MSKTFSVITVTYNAGDCLKKTLDSLLRQTWKNWELLIVDGESTDETMTIVGKYKQHISWYVSEKDFGVYDAMNKGILHAIGEWVLFLNAGDMLFDENVLWNLNQVIENSPQASVIYGNVQFIGENNFQKIKGKKIGFNSLLLGIPICHQATLIKRTLFHVHGLYDLSYSIIADYVWFVKYYLSGGNVHYYNGVISQYCEGGLSTQKLIKLQKERLRFVNSCYNVPHKIIFNILWVFIYIKSLAFVNLKSSPIWRMYRRIKGYKYTRGQ